MNKFILAFLSFFAFGIFPSFANDAFTDVEFGFDSDYDNLDSYDFEDEISIDEALNLSPSNTSFDDYATSADFSTSVGIIDSSTSLTDMFDDEKEIKEKAVLVGSEDNQPDTWLDLLRGGSGDRPKEKKSSTDVISDAPKSEGQVSSLRSMLEETKKTDKRSNAAVFDISGVMLHMTPAQVDHALTRRGYRKTNEKLEIPNFVKWRKEDECRAAGVVGYERLSGCVFQSAKAENYQYVDSVSYSKFDSQESMEIKFTSNFTGNKAFRIYYQSQASNVTGNSQKAIYLRNIKIYDFWKQINHKYGTPDDKDSVIWGMGGNKPYMQARTGKLLLEDPILRELDYTRMSREDQKFINTSTYSF